jgi:sialate O-acetylesterase
LVYGEPVEYSGPLVSGAKRTGDHVIVSFDHARGLKSKDGAPRQFEVAGEDGVFHSVDGQIDGERVRLNVGDRKGPLTVRYAYRQWPDGNLYNAAELPASPFAVGVR